jgi:hypothetical protein
LAPKVGPGPVLAKLAGANFMRLRRHFLSSYVFFMGSGKSPPNFSGAKFVCFEILPSPVGAGFFFVGYIKNFPRSCAAGKFFSFFSPNFEQWKRLLMSISSTDDTPARHYFLRLFF